jgi:hypothetical protein
MENNFDNLDLLNLDLLDDSFIKCHIVRISKNKI